MFKPFKVSLNFDDGTLSPCSNNWSRKFSEMYNVFLTGNKIKLESEEYDPIIYEVFDCTVPKEEGHLIPVTTKLFPGRIGDEYFMTKGHFHEKRKTAEVYVILQGEGVLLMQTEEGDTCEQVFSKGELLYIAPYWAHRMVNTGDIPLVFYGVYPADAGHDYGTIVTRGFLKRVVYDENISSKYKIINSNSQ
jgi:glucose-6-phosphate isomerase, archaeal